MFRYCGCVEVNDYLHFWVTFDNSIYFFYVLDFFGEIYIVLIFSTD